MIVLKSIILMLEMRREGTVQMNQDLHAKLQKRMAQDLSHLNVTTGIGFGLVSFNKKLRLERSIVKMLKQL